MENEEAVHAHRSILCARSEYFREKFAGEYVDLNLPGPPALVREVLRFFYSGLHPENLESLATELLPVAALYKANGLKELCVLITRRCLTVENLVDALISSFDGKSQELFDYCLPLFKANVSRLNSESLARLKKYPELMLKLTQRCAE